MREYCLFGWRIQSALQLPELQPWQGNGGAPDIVFDLGEVPPLDPLLPSFSPAAQIHPDAVRIAIPSVANYWVTGGRRVIIEPFLPEDAPDIRVFLLGTILAALCFQRGILPLHASAVEMDGRALLISGLSGAGKSTLAAAFSQRGYRLLSDDLCALTIDEAGAMAICPAFARVKLWRDAATHLAITTDGLERSRDELEKFHIPIAASLFHSTPLPPSQIIFLRTASIAGHRQTCRLSGLEALRRYDLVHRWRLGQAMGRRALIFKNLARLVDAVPVTEIARSPAFADLPALVDEIVALTRRAP